MRAPLFCDSREMSRMCLQINEGTSDEPQLRLPGDADDLPLKSLALSSSPTFRTYLPAPPFLTLPYPNFSRTKRPNQWSHYSEHPHRGNMPASDRWATTWAPINNLARHTGASASG